MKLTKSVLKQIIAEELAEAWKDDEEGYAAKIAKLNAATAERRAELESNPDKARKELGQEISNILRSYSKLETNMPMLVKQNVFNKRQAREVIRKAYYRVFNHFVSADNQKELEQLESFLTHYLTGIVIKPSPLPKGLGTVKKMEKFLQDTRQKIEAEKMKPETDQYRESNIKHHEATLKMYQDSLAAYNRSLILKDAFERYIENLAKKEQAAAEKSAGFDDADISSVLPDMSADDIDLGNLGRINESAKLRVKISK